MIKLFIYISLLFVSQLSLAQVKDTILTGSYDDSHIEQAQYPGGEKKWMKFVEENIDHKVADNNGALEGSYMVIAEFVVNKDGSVSDVKALTLHGYGMEEEFTRVIRKSIWEPARLHGQPIRSYKYEICTFKVPAGDAGEVFFQKIETEAYFPANVWKDFVANNLKPTVPVKQGAPVGIYKVIVEFIVQKDGTLTEFKATTKHGYGMEAEVLRMMKKSPKWVPATQNGKVVRSRKTLPVTFVVGTAG